MGNSRTPGKWPYRAGEPGKGKRVVKVKEEGTSGRARPGGVVRPEEHAQPWITPAQARLVLFAALASMTAAALWWGYHSPWLTITNVEVVGSVGVPADDIERAAAVDGSSTFSVDLEGAEARIEAMPKVRDATVTKLGWDTVRVVVEERVAWGSWQLDGVKVPIDIDGHVLDGQAAPDGAPVIVEVAPGRSLQPGDRLDAGSIELADRLVRESQTSFGRPVQALLYRQSAGLTVVLGPREVNGKPMWVTFGDMRDYDFKVASLFVLMVEAAKADVPLNVVDLRFGNRLVFN